MFEQLRQMRFGVALILAGLLFGFGLGGAFGAAEDSFKGTLQASADAVMVTVYQGDNEKAAAVVQKAWSYCKRAHMHGGGMGAAALAMVLLLAAMPGSRRYRVAASTMLGIGSLGYPLFWLLAAFRAPGLGSTGAAKESLALLAKPSAGLFIAGTAAVAVGFCLQAYRTPPTEA